MRIFNRKNPGFYIDPEGYIFPVSDLHAQRVIVVNGYLDIVPDATHTNIFDSVYANTPLADLFELNRMIRKNSFLKSQISQIYVNSNNEFDFTPQLGNHLIRFGTMEDAQKKLDNLDVFYRKALIGEGWDKFNEINLKYKNQVVCKRK